MPKPAEKTVEKLDLKGKKNIKMMVCDEEDKCVVMPVIRATEGPDVLDVTKL